MTHAELSRPIRWSEKAAYAVGDTASCFYWVTFSTYLLIFYTDTFGLSAKDVATMFLITRVWDALIDPFMGTLADRTQSKFGKFRPWILWGIAPLALAGIAMFITPNLSYGGKLVYAYVTYTVVMMAYTVVNVPYGALLGVITLNSQERTALAAYRFVGAFVGKMAVQGTLLFLVFHLGGGNNQTGFPLAFGLFAVAGAALLFWTFSGTCERVSPPAEKSSIAADFKDLVKNGPWVTLCVLGLITLIYISIRDGVTLYYFKYYLKDENASSTYLASGTFCSIIGALATPYCTRLAGSKKRALILLTAIGAVLMTLFFFVGPQNIVILYILNAIVSIPHAALFPLIWSMYADTADYGEWKTGRRATGLIFSAATFSQKVGWGVGGSVTGYILYQIGFTPNVAQSAETLLGIRGMVSFIPAAISLVAIVVMAFYAIDAKVERQMVEELNARKTAT